jgi:hypothetical protein
MAMRDDYGHAGTLRRLDAGRGILDRHGPRCHSSKAWTLPRLVVVTIPIGS